MDGGRCGTRHSFCVRSAACLARGRLIVAGFLPDLRLHFFQNGLETGSR